MAKYSTGNARKAGLSIAGAAVLTLAAFSSGSVQKADAASPTTLIASDQVWSTDGVLNPFNNSSEVLANGWYFSPMAMYKWTSPQSYYPMLASSWKISRDGSQLTIHLNPHAKWSNGTPVTSEDVYVTFELEFMQNTPQSYFLTKVVPDGSSTLVFYRNPKVNESPAIFERQVLNQAIYPAAVFKKYVPANINSIVAESEAFPVTKAVNSAISQLATLATKVSGMSFTPSQLIYDGPWALSAVNSATQLLVKNPYFFAAKNVTADRVIYYNLTTNDLGWRMLEAGEADYVNVALTPPVTNAIKHVPGNKLALVAPGGGMDVMFNLADYPFNLVQVRQALAYAINRPSVQKIAEPISGYVLKYEDSSYNAFNKLWLSGKQLASLNPYDYNLAKAGALLKSVGFKDTKAGWVMPNGKPFSFNINVMSPYSDYVEGADVIASQLRAFGVKAEPAIQNGNIFFNNQLNGDYPVSISGTVSDILPYYIFEYYLTADGYSINPIGQLVKSSTKTEQNIPSSIQVPGMGTVNPMVLDWKLMYNQSKQAEQKVIYDETRVSNYLMPVIPVFGQYSSNVISDARWTWPAVSNPVWLGNGHGYGFVPLFQTLGLMQPK